METFEPSHPHTFRAGSPDFAQRITQSFAAQGIMQTFGATLGEISAGRVEIKMPFHAGLTQQHGYLHASAVAALADSACGYAALSLFRTGFEVVSLEYKVNFLEPAVGITFVAVGQALRGGGKVIPCRGTVTAHTQDGKTQPVAEMMATMYAVAIKG